jgi:DNA-damage-inducible protein J
MAKTIQVRVDDNLKQSADLLFSSLGLDTSTAIRMFLIAAMEARGIPFIIAHGVDRDTDIRKSITRRKAGGQFYTADEFLTNMKIAMTEGASDAKEEI